MNKQFVPPLLLKVIFFLVGIHFGFSQKENMEVKALNYLCENLSKIDNDLTSKKIYFKNNITEKPSNIFYALDCFKEISLLKNEIPNEEVLTKIENKNYSKKYLEQKVNFECSHIKGKNPCIFNKNPFLITVYNSITYKEKHYVQININDDGGKSSRFVFVLFDKDKKIIDHCHSYFIFD